MWLFELIESWTWTEWLALSVCFVLVVLPPRYDPVIRLKEWIDGLGR